MDSKNCFLLYIVLLAKEISGYETIDQIVRVKQEILSDLYYYQSCATSGEYVYAAFERESNTCYQTLTSIEGIVKASVDLISGTRNVTTGQFDTALGDTKRLIDEGYEKIKLYVFGLYSKGVAYQSQLTAVRKDVSATDVNNLPCNRASPEYENCLNGVLSSLQSTKSSLTTLGTEVCSVLNNTHTTGLVYAETVYNDNTAAAKAIVDSQLTEYAITRAEIITNFETKIQTVYNRTVSDYYKNSQPYETKLKNDIHRKLNALNIIIADIDAGLANARNNASYNASNNDKNNALITALNTLKSRINYVYTEQYNFITDAFNTIAAFDFVGQIAAERDKIGVTNMQMQCENTTSTLVDFFLCAQTMYERFVSASDRVQNQYTALVYIDFPKDTPWWRIKFALPRYIGQTLPHVPTNSKLEQGLKCFRDYNIVYRTAEEIETRYKFCSS